MAYKLLYTKTAVKDIQKLDSIAKKRIKKKLEELSKDPKGLSKKLINSSIGTYRYRVGNYRIVFDIDKQNIVILRVGHRREIYRK
ncbi:MAG: type II toxin-antitoxin system RelE/ParE family toxin [Candidatus Levybacteria bacterium]|nr:type II toxin-antitoxin system RelE/ParE family toxin [Candidatus Levybacteria bacterium]